VNVAISAPEHGRLRASTRRRRLWLEALGRAPAVRWFSGMWRYPNEHANAPSASVRRDDGAADDERVFWDVKDPDKAVVIELDHERYTRLIGRVDDPPRGRDPHRTCREQPSTIASPGPRGDLFRGASEWPRQTDRTRWSSPPRHPGTPHRFGDIRTARGGVAHLTRAP
jgi:hypothetical protein